jgi:hypothetical protein
LYVQAFKSFHLFLVARKATFGVRLSDPVDEFNAAACRHGLPVRQPAAGTRAAGRLLRLPADGHSSDRSSSLTNRCRPLLRGCKRSYYGFMVQLLERPASRNDRRSLAAVTIASTSWTVMSPSTTSIAAMARECHRRRRQGSDVCPRQTGQDRPQPRPPYTSSTGWTGADDFAEIERSTSLRGAIEHLAAEAERLRRLAEISNVA